LVKFWRKDTKGKQCGDKTGSMGLLEGGKTKIKIFFPVQPVKADCIEHFQPEKPITAYSGNGIKQTPEIMLKAPLKFASTALYH